MDDDDGVRDAGSAVGIELVATCWTSAGDVAPLRGPEISPFAIEDRVREIARGGWAGLSLGQDDLRVVRDGMGLAALRDLIAEHGLRHIEVELLTDWWDGTATSTEAVQMRELLLEAAQVLGASQLKLAALGEPLADTSPLHAPLGDLCDRAEERGVRLALEAMPFGLVARVPKIAELLAAVDRPATFGVFLDCWQFFRAGNDLAELREQIDIQRVFGVELDDAAAQVRGTLLEDTIDHRLLPGAGDLDLRGFISTLAEMGWRGPWGVEVMSVEHRRRPLEEALRVAYESASRVLYDVLG